MRCPDCNKFVGMETEIESTDLTGDVSKIENGARTVDVSGSVRVVRNCSECGQTLKSCEFEISHAYEVPKDHVGDGHEIEVDASNDAETVEDVQRTDRRGRPIRNSRYMRTLIGFTVDVEIKCSCGELDESITISDTTPASAFDEEV